MLGVVSAGTVYGLLSPVVGRLPLLSATLNTRFIAVLCLVLAALAGVGVETIAQRPTFLRPSGRLLAAAGATGLAGLALAAVVLRLRGSGVDSAYGTVRGYLAFWVFVAATSAGAVPCRASPPWRCSRAFSSRLLTTPRVPPPEVPPRSAVVDWLRANAGDHAIAATSNVLIPDTATYYGLYDVRGVDVAIEPRLHDYGAAADPGYIDWYHYTLLDRPSVDWLAAAGVAYLVTPADHVIAGTSPVYSAERVTVASVPGARPFAFAAARTVAVDGAAAALKTLRQDPLGPVLIEGGCCATPASSADSVVAVTRREAGEVDLRVAGPAPAVVVVLQTGAPVWVASVDGRAATLRPAGLLFQSVAVPAGSHQVALRYRPRSVDIGLALSALGIVGLGAMLLLPWSIPQLRRR